MDPLIGAALIGGGASLIGGLMSSGGSSYSSSTTDIGFLRNQAKLDRQLQKRALLDSVTIRANDAQRAYERYGIHPLVGMGASPANVSPVAVGSPVSSSSRTNGSDLGQNISRSVHSGLDTYMRGQSMKLAEQQVKNATLNNEILEQQLASEKMRMATNPPAPPLPSVLPKNEQVKLQAHQRTTSPSKDKQFMTAGNIPQTSFAATSTGLMPVVSKDLKDSIEDSAAETAVQARMYASPLWSDKEKPPYSLLKKTFPGAVDSKWNGIEWKALYPKDKIHYKKGKLDTNPKKQPAYKKKVWYRMLKDITSTLYK